MITVDRREAELLKTRALARAFAIKHGSLVAPALPVDISGELKRCREDFRSFLQYWHFKNRETGEVLTFANLWPGQRALADQMVKHRWLFALKAGKLGFTELEIAFDAWVALFGPPNARVHLFSKDSDASRELLRYLKFGLYKLPSWMGLRFLQEQAGGLTARSVRFKANWMGPDDERTVVSYAATGNVAIDQTATHNHVDELSHMQDAEALWNSVATTVAPEGSCHIVTRGAGDSVYSAVLWGAATSGNSKLVPFFAAYDARPGRDAAYRAREAASLTELGLSYFLPETPEDALRGDDENSYIPVDRWDQLQHALPPMRPGDRTPLVLALDAAVSNDCFAIVGATRHPERPQTDVALRLSKIWRPADFPDGRIDFAEPENLVRLLCKGGCRAGHAMPLPTEKTRQDCPYCAKEDWSLKPLNVVEVTFDPHQLVDMDQRLTKAKVAVLSSFDQGAERLEGDALMYQLAYQGRLSHHGDPTMRENIGNAKAQIPKGEDSKMRIVKRGVGKIDGVVAAAMAVKRCLDIPLAPVSMSIGSITGTSKWR